MRCRIWSQYNKELVQRGSITFFVDEKSLKAIRNFRPKSTGGRPQEFPLVLIQLMNKWFKVPTYSPICKRAKETCLISTKTEILSKVVLIDASGIKVFGEREWKRKIHGVGRSRK